MPRIFSQEDEQYYFDILNKEPPKITHNNPDDYRIDDNFIYKAKNRYRHYQKKQYEQRLQQIYREREDWTDKLRRRIGAGQDDFNCFWYRCKIEKANNEISNLRKRIAYLSLPKTKATKIDFDLIKTIPIGKVFEVLPNGFFMENPLRQERKPSNSFFWNKKTNKWNDYGTGEYGDLLDLTMLKNNWSLKEAYLWITQNYS